MKPSPRDNPGDTSGRDDTYADRQTGASAEWMRMARIAEGSERYPTKEEKTARIKKEAEQYKMAQEKKGFTVVNIPGPYQSLVPLRYRADLKKKRVTLMVGSDGYQKLTLDIDRLDELLDGLMAVRASLK